MKSYFIDLWLNNRLIPENYFIKYQYNGKYIMNNFTEEVIYILYSVDIFYVIYPII